MSSRTLCCRGPQSVDLLAKEDRISPQQLRDRLAGGEPAILLDVRPAEQFALAHLPGACLLLVALLNRGYSR